MFDNLSERLERSFKLLKGEGKITEINVAETLKDVRRALLDADVNYKVAKTFTDKVKEKALGQNVLTSVKPSQLMVKIVHDELVERLVQAHRNGRVAILELGVGLRNGIIKHMLAQIANVCEHATYIVFNYSQAMAPDASCETILVDGDMAPAFEEIAQCRL